MILFACLSRLSKDLRQELPSPILEETNKRIKHFFYVLTFVKPDNMLQPELQHIIARGLGKR